MEMSWRLSVVAGILCTASIRAAAQDAPATQPAGLNQVDPNIAKIVAEISQDRIAATMKTLGGFETRNTMSDPNQLNRGVGAARQWIFDQFKSFSPRLQVSFDTHQIPKGGRVWKPVELRNVIAVLPGKRDKDRWILIGGHYDTVNLKVPPEMRGHPEKAAELSAPGVSDDASGVACEMECARVMSRREFDATLVFVAFAGEEQGLVGSRAMAQRLKANGQQIEAVLRWSVDHEGPAPAGFVVVMRPTTAPDWEREFWAGDVREYTLRDMPIDQWVFGIKAVDQAGHESPASAYVLPPMLRGATSD